MTQSDRRFCNKPDHDEPRITCGYPLPCPWHTVIVDLNAQTVSAPIGGGVVPAEKAGRIGEIAKALSDLRDRDALRWAIDILCALPPQCAQSVERIEEIRRRWTGIPGWEAGHIGSPLATAGCDVRDLLGAYDTLRADLQSDRTGLAAGLVAVVDRCRGASWIAEGRGSYEWDDDRYREETRVALDAIVSIATTALRESGALVTEAFNGPLDAADERDAAVARTEKAELALSACEAQRRPIGRAISAWGVWCYGEGWCPAFATPERYGTQQEAVTAMARWVNENPGSKYSTRMMVIGDTGPTCDRGPKACDAEIDRLRTMLRKVAAPRCSDRDGFAWHCAECLKPVAGPKADCKDSDCSLATALRGY